MEALRFNAGLPVYETGHATHLYGPLLTVLLGAFSKSSVLFHRRASYDVDLCLRRRDFPERDSLPKKSRAFLAMAFLLLLGINFRTNLIVFSTQPDWACRVSGRRLALSLDRARELGLCGRGFPSRSLLARLCLNRPAPRLRSFPSLTLCFGNDRCEFVISLSPVCGDVDLACARGDSPVLPQMFHSIFVTPSGIRIYPSAR